MEIRMTSRLPTLAVVRARFVSPEDDTWLACETCTLGAVAANSDGESVLRYLNDLGFRPATTADLFQQISALEDEEELSAFECREGVAVTHASDGWWLLFVDGDA